MELGTAVYSTSIGFKTPKIVIARRTADLDSDGVTHFGNELTYWNEDDYGWFVTRDKAKAYHSEIHAVDVARDFEEEDKENGERRQRYDYIVISIRSPLNDLDVNE